jgi:hypothetical protein
MDNINQGVMNNINQLGVDCNYIDLSWNLFTTTHNYRFLNICNPFDLNLPALHLITFLLTSTHVSALCLPFWIEWTMILLIVKLQPFLQPLFTLIVIQAYLETRKQSYGNVS